MTKDTGGPAFPESFSAAGPFGGMTLRDYIAIHAMAGTLGGEPGGHLHPDKLATASYEYADAMIAERSKP